MSGFKAAEAVAALDYDFGEDGKPSPRHRPRALAERLQSYSGNARKEGLEDAGIDATDVIDTLDPEEGKVALAKASPTPSESTQGDGEAGQGPARGGREALRGLTVEGGAHRRPSLSPAARLLRLADG
jgi:hypothetical protein